MTDLTSITFTIQEFAKGNILQKLSSIHDGLGFKTCTLKAKGICCNICDEKIPCDKELPPSIKGDR